MSARKQARDKRASCSLPSVGPTSACIVVVGTQAAEPLRVILSEAIGGIFFGSNPDLTNIKVDVTSTKLAIGLFEDEDEDQCTQCLTFAKWAHSTDTPSLCVLLRQGETLIGPLALPDKPGCVACASRRIAAARGTQPLTRSSDKLTLSPRMAVSVGRTLIQEVKRIVRRGPEQSQLLNHVLFLNSKDLDASLHRVIPMSRCTICGGASRFPIAKKLAVRLSSNDTPEVMLDALSGWVDGRTGVISGVFLEPPSSPRIDLPIIATTAPPYIVCEDGTPQRLPLGWGKGLTVAGAVISAVGEAIERYAASQPDPDRIKWARPSELDGDRLDPRLFAFYTDAQYERSDFPFVRFDANVQHPWVLGKWLWNRKPVWVPAVLSFLSLELQPEHLILQGSSNGLAAATDYDEAALRATMELVERDAFMAAWLTARPGQRLELDDTFDPLLRRVLNGIESLGATVEIYTLPTSVCGTTVLCLGLGDGTDYPGATIGLGSDLDPYLALRQAVLELGQTGPYLRRMMQSGQLLSPKDPRDVRDMLHHAAYYFPHQRAQSFSRLRHSGDSRLCSLRDLADLEQKRSLKNCASVLNAANIRVALVDITSADVATGPFRVVRAVSPDLQPLWYGYGLESQPVERIRNIGIDADLPEIQPIM